ncbi:Kinesin light chain protein [Giardia muris]|uniref:Kinesin light chain protein n=1 Tax=Giardia muris TaxID=5742 RepID=A0A4Z1T5R0_GIAMU|nr:Kinesin light chain protein [Giardia muris]|eukprot:TNJ29393.1 Kinesin light chain protein [Giardia muris]
MATYTRLRIRELQDEARAYMLQGQFTDAIDVSDGVLHILQRAPENEQHVVDQLYFLLLRAEAYTHRGDFGRAQTDLDEHVPPLLALLPEAHPYNITHTIDTLQLSLARGDCELAYRSAKRLVATVRGTDSDSSASANAQLARTLTLFAHSAAGTRRFDEALLALAEARSIYVYLGHETEAELVRAHAVSVRLLAGDRSNTVNDMTEICEHFLQVAPTWPGMLSLYHNMATALKCDQRPGDAAQFLVKAVDMSRKLFGDPSPEYQQELLALAQTQLALGNVEECKLLLERVRKSQRAESDGHYWLLHGDLSLQINKIDDAVESYRKAVQFLPNPVMKHDAEQALASALHFAGKFQEALAILDELAVRYEGEETQLPRLASVYVSMGNILRQQGQFKEALAIYNKALSGFSKCYGPNHPYTATVKINIGGIHHAQQRYRMALGFFTHVKAIRETTFGDNHPLTIRLYMAIAHTYAAIYVELASQTRVESDETRSAFDDAVCFYERALRACTAVYGSESSETVEVRRALGEIRRRRS